MKYNIVGRDLLASNIKNRFSKRFLSTTIRNILNHRNEEKEIKIPRNYNKIEKVFDKSSEMIYNFCELFINNNSE